MNSTNHQYYNQHQSQHQPQHKPNNIILEDGYNSDYIYSMITALFYTPCDGTNKLMNSDTSSFNSYYVQEFIKAKFIYPIHRSISIESGTVNKLRLYLYDCGWLKNDDKHILTKGDLDRFYSFLVCEILEYKLSISKIEQDTNKAIDLSLDLIRISDKHMLDPISITSTDKDVGSGEIGKVINLSLLVNRWIRSEILETSISYKFEVLPYIIPVYLDIRDSDTGLNKRYVNVMEGLNFPDNGDKSQSMLIWEIHSMICQTDKGECYTIVIDHNDDLMVFSDKHIPSNWKVDVTNISVVKKIMREVRFVFYKLQ